jgi:hypothetical protein
MRIQAAADVMALVAEKTQKSESLSPAPIV